MKLSIEPALAARFPAYRMFTVVATGVDNAGDDEALRAKLRDVAAQVRRDSCADPEIGQQADLVVMPRFDQFWLLAIGQASGLSSHLA